MEDAILKFESLLNNVINTGYCNTKELPSIKIYLENNKDKEEIKKIRRKFAEYIYNLYNNEKLTNALNDEYVYRRIVNAYKLDPFKYNSIYNKEGALNILFSNSIFIPIGSYFENNINWFLDDSGLGELENPKILRDIYKRYKHLSQPDKYGSFNQEFEKYEKSLNGLEYDMPNDYEEFKNNKKLESEAFNRYYEGNPIIDYQNKRLGNIGEIYVYENLIKNSIESIFVSRDCGDGFGYDIHTLYNDNNTIKEGLIEVKATSNENKDFFALTDEEYNTMIDTLNNDKVKYFVCLCYVDVKKKQVVSKPFIVENKTTFRSLVDDELYVFDKIEKNQYYFKSNVNKLDNPKVYQKGGK